MGTSSPARASHPAGGRLKRLFAGLLGAGIIGYSLVLLALAALWQTAPTATAWITLSNIFALYLFAPMPLALVIALLLRQPLTLSVALTTTVAGALLLGPLLLPHRPAPAENARTVRVISFNQLYTNTSTTEIIGELQRHEADIILLQELSPALADALDELRALYPHQAMQPAYASPYGLGIVSRYPLEDVRWLEPITDQIAVVRVDDQPITLLNVHTPPPSVQGRQPTALVDRLLHYDSSQRDAHLRNLLGRVANHEGTLLMSGDFNLAPREPLYAAFAAQLRDTHTATWGPGFTFPNPQYGNRWWMPRVRIDYVWVSSPLRPLNSQVSCAVTSSDHCMRIVDIALPPTSASLLLR